MAVQVLEPAQELATDDGDRVLAKDARLELTRSAQLDRTLTDQIGAGATAAELHDDPELGAAQKGAVHLGHERRVEARQDRNLLRRVRRPTTTT